MTYLVQRMEGGRAKTVLSTESRYHAMATYNEMSGQRWVLQVSDTGGQVIRSSDEDGTAADFAANNHKEPQDVE